MVYPATRLVLAAAAVAAAGTYPEDILLWLLLLDEELQHASLRILLTISFI